MRLKIVCLCLGGSFGLTVGLTTEVLAAVPQSPRIANVEILADQGWTNNSDTIWYDNFESNTTLNTNYVEYVNDSGEFAPITSESLGGSGRSMRVRWQAGEVGAGNLKKTFGRAPGGYLQGPASRPTEDFTEVYWRQYVKMQEGWTGNPSKLNRAISFAKSDWSQAMIAHIWDGSPTGIKTDPVSGVNSASQVVTNGYNDFGNFTWLGGNGASSSNAQIFNTAESGRWVSVEGRVKLNTPGQSNGIFQLWVDGQLEASRTNLNWVYSWDDYGINAVFLENWWNNGSPVEQERYFDDFVISTAPIGLATSPLNPLVTKTSFSDPDGGDTQAAWQLQIASSLSGSDLVWDSGDILGAGLSIEVNNSSGSFLGSLSGADRLLGEQLYAVRARQQDSSGQWSSWSPWNTSLQTGLAVGPLGDFDQDGDTDGADFLLWQRDTSVGSLSDWQADYGAAAALSSAVGVPEPSSAVLFGASALLASMLASRRQACGYRVSSRRSSPLSTNSAPLARGFFR